MKQEEIKKHQQDRLKEHLIKELEIDKDLLLANTKIKCKEIDRKIMELKKWQFLF